MQVLTPEIWSRYKVQVRETLTFLPSFFRNPVQKMRQLPRWEWPTILTLHAAFAGVVGFIVGILKFKFLLIFLSVFSSVFSALLIGFLGTTFFYYLFLFLLNRKEDFLQLYCFVAVASLPMLALRVLSPIGAPINLVGFAIMCLLCTVGLVDSFKVPKRMAFRVMGGVYSLFFVFWVVDFVRSSREEVSARQHVTPESLDILQKELAPPAQ